MVIDVQQGLSRKSTPIFRAEPLLDTITTLIERAHAAGGLVACVQHASDKVLPFGSANWQLHPRLQGRAKAISSCTSDAGNAFEDMSLHPMLGDALRAPAGGADAGPDAAGGYTIRPVAGETKVHAVITLHRAAFGTEHTTAADARPGCVRPAMILRWIWSWWHLTATRPRTVCVIRQEVNLP